MHGLTTFSGGSALASKLLHVYFTLFKMLLSGRIGYAAEADRKRQDKAAAKGLDKKRASKKGAKKADAPDSTRSGQDAAPMQVGVSNCALSGRLTSMC